MNRAVESRKRKSTGLFAAITGFLLMLGLGVFLVGCEMETSEEGTADGLVQAEVVRVVDGDTLMIDLNGEHERLRLIGINCPESVAEDESRNTEEGVEASDYTKSIVEPGDIVWLESDTNDRDQYDRLLRYVWLEQPSDVFDPNEIESKMLNAILVRDGYAQAHRYGNDDLHFDVLKELGQDAIADSRGVSYAWS